MQALTHQTLAAGSPAANICIGHVRYSTNGMSSICHVHPFAYPTDFTTVAPHPELLLCGNFHFAHLEQKEQKRHAMPLHIAEIIGKAISTDQDLASALHKALSDIDGGFALCGLTSDGRLFAVRDSHGIRPLYYVDNEEVLALASEPFALTAIPGIEIFNVQELAPGCVIYAKDNQTAITDNVLGRALPAFCPFEQIYFSSNKNLEIQAIRRELGRTLAQEYAHHLDENTIITYVPNSAVDAYEGFTSLASALHARILEKTEDVRNFIAESDTRDLECKVAYKVADCKTLSGKSVVVIDDSIVRGTTMRQSIIPTLRQLHPSKITVLSASPQVRYPDCYGIDLSSFEELVAFRAAVSLLRQTHEGIALLQGVYNECLQCIDAEIFTVNPVKQIYDKIDSSSLNARIASLLGDGTPLDVHYLSIEELHKCLRPNSGDWFFSGNYPTRGGYRFVCNAYIEFYQGILTKQ